MRLSTTSSHESNIQDSCDESKIFSLRISKQLFFKLFTYTVYLLISKYNLSSQKFVNVAGLVFPVDPMQGADPLKAALFDQVLHGQVILMGVDSNGLDVIEATGEVVYHCLVELRSIAVTSVVGVDGHPVDGNVVIGIYLPVAVQLVIGVVRRWNDGQGPDGSPSSALAR